MGPGPIVKEEKAGKKAWCACGGSQTQPYCDGTHSRNGSGKKPVIVDITEEKSVAWCSCRKTNNPPYCDGSHAR